MKSVNPYSITDKDNLSHSQFWDLMDEIMRLVIFVFVNNKDF